MPPTRRTGGATTRPQTVTRRPRSAPNAAAARSACVSHWAREFLDRRAVFLSRDAAAVRALAMQRNPRARLLLTCAPLLLLWSET